MMKTFLQVKPVKLKNSVRCVLETHSHSIAFFMVFVFIACYNLIHKAGTPFYYDSGQYWSLQYSFTREGVWSLLHYDNTLRGYLFPLILHAVSVIAGLLELTDTRLLGLVMATVYSAGITIAIPFIVEKLFHRKVTLAQICLFAIFVIIFWRGYFYYPLADFPALFSIIFGLCLALLPWSKTEGGILDAASLTLAGMLWAAATNIRPSYLIAAATLVCWIFLYHRNVNKYPLKRCVSLLAAVLLGAVIVLSPQFAINAINFNKPTPFVLAEIEGRNLFLQQLAWGIKIQKYETNVGNVYPVAPVRFMDPHGEHLLAQANSVPSSFTEYVRFVLRYPLDFAVMYARRIFNGLDVTYPSAYTSDILQNAIGIRWLNYSVLFLALLYLARQRLANIAVYKAVAPFLLILPSIVSVPTAIEVRFMLPVFFVVYGIIAYFAIPAFRKPVGQVDKDRLIKIILLYLAFVIICFMLSVNTFMGLEFGDYILHGQ